MQMPEDAPIMIPAIVTDELSDSPETAFELGLEWGVRHFELRGMHDARVPRLSPTQRRRLLRAIRDFDVRISAIGGRPSGRAPGRVADVLAHAAELAQSANVSLIIENEESHWANTGALSAALIAATGAPIGINWDPANALIDGDTPWPDGYAACRHLVRNVHFKDARVHADNSWELLADGDVDWAGQVMALEEDGYAGCVAMEPHLWPSVASVRNALSRFNTLKNN
jgi:sugar phosphate isomerase/epimerase